MYNFVAENSLLLVNVTPLEAKQATNNIVKYG